MKWDCHVRPLTDDAIRNRWASLASSVGHSPFSTLAYHDAITIATGYNGAIILANSSGNDEAGIIVNWRKLGPYRKVIIPPFTAYSYPLFRRHSSESDVHGRNTPLDALLEAIENHFDIAHLHLPPFVCDVRTCQWRGWTASPLFTYGISLTDNVAIRDAWSQGPRRTFAHAHESYSAACDTHAAIDVVRLLQISFDRQKRVLPMAAERLIGLIEALQAAGLASIYSVSSINSDEPEAAVAVLHYGSRASYWIAGSIPGPAMTVLLGNMLPELQKKGIEEFDFFGANTPTIAEFKRRFGPQLFTYYRIGKITALIPRLFATFRK